MTDTRKRFNYLQKHLKNDELFEFLKEITRDGTISVEESFLTMDRINDHTSDDNLAKTERIIERYEKDNIELRPFEKETKDKNIYLILEPVGDGRGINLITVNGLGEIQNRIYKVFLKDGKINGHRLYLGGDEINPVDIKNHPVNICRGRMKEEQDYNQT